MIETGFDNLQNTCFLFT